MEKNGRKVTVCLFILYALLILWLLLVRRPDIITAPYWQHTAQHLNLKLFRTIRLTLWHILHPGNPRLFLWGMVNLAGNVILFIPLGYFLPEIFPALRRLYRTVLAVAVMISAAEILQMLLLVGTCDVDDLILNVVGGCLGYGIYRLANR